MKYYFGIYIDYSTNIPQKIAEVTDSVDCLSCEMLASPGLIELYVSDLITLRKNAKEIAKKHNCQFIEFNYNKYQRLKLTNHGLHNNRTRKTI